MKAAVQREVCTCRARAPESSSKGPATNGYGPRTCRGGARARDARLLPALRGGLAALADEAPALVIAALPRDDSPSAARYVAEREGETAWTMHLTDDDEYDYSSGEKVQLPEQIGNQINQREHVGAQLQPSAFDPNARAWDEDNAELPANFKAPSLDE